MPNSTAGMIIGKGGNFIKQIKEESGSYVQISQKSKEHTLSERCITVIGEMENNKRACTMIISKIMEDPQSGSCLNVSYADVQGPVANYNPTGSPFANASQAGSSAGYSPNGSLGSMSPGMAAAAQMGSYTNPQGMIAASMAAMAQSTNAQQFIENFHATLRGTGYSEEATAEITTAMNTLANYGMLGLSLGLSGFGATMANPVANTAPLGINMNMNMNAANMYATTAQAASASPMDTTGPGIPSNSMFGPIGSVAATAPGGFGSPTGTPRCAGERYMQTDPPAAAVYDPFRRQSPTLGSPVNTAGQQPAPVTPASAGTLPINNNSFGLGTGIGGSLSKSPGPTDASGSQDPGRVEVEVGENIVGAILGSGGKTLVEIQHLSGANVQISKKGIFAPGTRNRVVTITGTPNAVGMAQYLIEQRISEEEAKRARQNVITVVR